MNKEKSIKLITFLLMFFSLLLSFSYNIFHVSEDFERFQKDSEVLVIDGINNALLTNEPIKLGRLDHERPNYANAVDRFNNGSDTYDEFIKYRSQYGLQGKLFYYLTIAFNIDDVMVLKLINASLFSTLFMYILFWIRKEFDKSTMFVFYATFVFSPWVVNIIGNLYWSPFLWILPIVMAIYYSEVITEPYYKKIIPLTGLFVSYLIKFLSGYEYISMIGMISIIPIIVVYCKNKIDISNLFKETALFTFVYLTSFLLSIYIFISNLGYERLVGIILKRVDTGKIKDVKDCVEANIISANHCDGLVNALNRDIIDVVLGYFKMKNFFPQQIETFLPNISTLTIILLVLLSVFVSLLIRNRWSILILFSLVCSLSWFFLAKGHSIFHPHINFILWYFPFIPVSISVLIILIRKNKRFIGGYNIQ